MFGGILNINWRQVNQDFSDFSLIMLEFGDLLAIYHFF